MMSRLDRYIADSRFNERTHRFFSAALVSLMMASAGLTIAQFGHQMIPNWNGFYLVPIGFLISLERFYSHRLLKKLSSMSREWIVLISSQWIVNMVVIKLIVSLSKGIDALLAEIPLWQGSFSQVFFSTEYLVAIFFAGLAWFIAGLIAELLDDMGLNAALVSREVMFSTLQNQGPPRQRLMATVFAVGGFLMFLTAAARVDTRALFANDTDVLRELSPLEGGGAGTLLYFVFVFLLLSQARYITLNTRWFMQKIPVSRSIAVNWFIYSIIFLVLIGAVVALLPTSYSLGLLSVLGYLIDIIVGLIVIIATLIMAIVGFLISLPFLLLGLDQPMNNTGFEMAPIETPPPPVVTEIVPIPWLEILKSLLFWVIFLIVIGYAIAQYLRQHEEILAGFRKIPGWKIIAAIFHWFNGLFGRMNQRVTNLIQSGKERIRPRIDSPNLRVLPRFLRLRNLSPRQKVFFYYQALLRRGNETGISRIVSQTPDEYAKGLERTMPTIEDEINSMTEAFNEARYSRSTVDPEAANAVKEYWEHIRKVFRGRRG